jgi:hypothetical protein
VGGWIGGWIDGCKCRFKDFYSNKKCCSIVWFIKYVRQKIAVIISNSRHFNWIVIRHYFLDFLKYNFNIFFPKLFTSNLKGQAGKFGNKIAPNRLFKQFQNLEVFYCTFNRAKNTIHRQ